MEGTNNNDEGKAVYANRHIGKFLSMYRNNTNNTNDIYTNNVTQVVTDGKTLTAKRLLQSNRSDDDATADLTLRRPILVKDTPESIGMKVLSFPRRQVAVRDIADIVGHDYPVHVIDVEHQEELEGWNMGDLVDYFEDEQRLFQQHQEEVSDIYYNKDNNNNNISGDNNNNNNNNYNNNNRRQRRRRKAAEKCINQNKSKPRVLNQISLEFSSTPLKHKILSPKFVRDLDWIDRAWPPKDLNNGIYPNVQYYCLTSAAGCYTDFHIDFGGTSVWYHIMSGSKIFCLIEPTVENVAIYEEWLCRPDQAQIFLPDMIHDRSTIVQLSLEASETLVIPTAWIHSVYTPTDSVVLGGNFLHGLDISLQLQVHCVEARTKVKEQFRFPHFLALQFYAGGYYLSKLRSGNIVQREVDGLLDLIHSLKEWWKVQSQQSQIKTGPTVVSAAKSCATDNYCDSVEEFLEQLEKEHERVVRDGICPNQEFLNKIKESSSSSSSSSSHGTKTTTKRLSLSLGRPKLRLKLNTATTTTSSTSAPTTPSTSTPKIPPPPPPPPPPQASKSADTLPQEPEPLSEPQLSPKNENDNGNNNNDTGNAKVDDDPFRIVVSASSTTNIALPIQTKKSRGGRREDKEWYEERIKQGDDDEWVPSTRKNRRLSSSSSEPKSPRTTTPKATTTKQSKTTKQSSKRVSVSSNNTNNTKRPKPSTTTTSRQRLMKRLGR